MCSVCTVYVQCMYVYVQCMYSVCTVYVRVCTVYVDIQSLKVDAHLLQRVSPCHSVRELQRLQIWSGRLIHLWQKRIEFFYLEYLWLLSLYNIHKH